MKSSIPTPSTIPSELSTPSELERPRGRSGEAVARGIAAFVSLFALLNLAIELRHPRYDANLWWISFRPLPGAVRGVALGVASLLFLAYAIDPEMVRWRRRATRTMIELLWVMVAWNILTFYVQLARGRFHAGFPVPFSLFVAIALGWIWRMAADEEPAPRGFKTAFLIAVTVFACLVAFPLLQMFCFGKTSYRRKEPDPADIVVVFGARVYADGRPSDALKDRVNKAVDLFKAKEVSRLYLSGGRAEGEPDEAEAMRKVAIEGGVPSDRISLDQHGDHTEETVEHALAYLEAHPSEHRPVILAVSHFYHLPRVKMCFGENGADVLTVPVGEPLSDTPKYMLREIPALWVYYLRALLQ